jgi:cell division transport system permease protein
MADKYNRRRTRSASVTTVISLSLVLFMLGMLGFLVLSAKKVSDYFKENIPFQCYIREDASEADIRKFQKTLEASRYVKSAAYISREDALEIYKKDVGEDFLPLLGKNILPASLDLHLVAAYAHADSIAWIKKDIMESGLVSEFRYVESLVTKINDNLGKVSLVFLLIIGVLSIIAIALINNTIRLAIYSKRFIIKTMQLVGATAGFISRPFLLQGVLQGIYGALLAMIFLAGSVYFLKRGIPDLLQVLDERLFLGLFGLILVSGILISLASTFFAVRKYLRLRRDDLYN